MRMQGRTAAALRFEGFADREARFFHALAKNQRREWFQVHRREYEEGWLAPMRALLAETRERIDAFFPQHPLGEPKVFRIHRDVRFSKDKSPYKTHIGGYVPIQQGGEGPAVPTPVYVHVGTDVYVGAGHYMMTPEQLARYRESVLDERRGRALPGILAKLARNGFLVRSQDVLRKVPRGLDPDHARADLLKRKGLVVSFPALPKGLLVSRGLVDWLVKHAKQAAPLVEWLASSSE
jgi:uncharacterized protein (TIGR02453 family)